MELRLRKAIDLENGSGPQLSDMQNKNAELEILVQSLKNMLDISRHRERKILKVLEEAGIDHHIELSSEEDLQDLNLQEPTLMKGIIDRSGWLIGLLIFQSLSSFILKYNESLLQSHPSIVYYLTMLVGAGGNAGNQATVRAIRGIALGTLTKETTWKFITREIATGLALSFALGVFGLIRVMVLATVTFPEAIAISIALVCIVFSSVFLGAILPVFFQRIGIDPAHSSTTIQVIMDILGVIITCSVSTTLLDTILRKTQ
jgi:Mg/Co/Ni transporter MgtE